MDIYEYVRNLNTRDELFPDMLDHAEINRVPIMDADALNVLKHYIELQSVKHILEVGTAIGYSAMHMLSVSDDISVVTIEKDEASHGAAGHFFKVHGMEERVTHILGDAKEIDTASLGGHPFDLLFIDASKGNNQRFYERFSPLVKDGGLIIVDNILLRGLVVEEALHSRGARRMKEKVDGFNRSISEKGASAVFLPVGDGLLVIRKDKEGDGR